MRAAIIPVTFGLVAMHINAYSLPELFRQGWRASVPAPDPTGGLQPSREASLSKRRFLNVHPIAHGEALANRLTDAHGTLGVAMNLKKPGVSVLDNRGQMEVYVAVEDEMGRKAKPPTVAISTQVEGDVEKIKFGEQEAAVADSNPSPSPPIESDERKKQKGGGADAVSETDLEKRYLEQLQHLRANHLQADQKLEAQQAVERKKMRDEQQAAVDSVMKNAGGRPIKDYAYKEEDAVKPKLIPLHIEFEVASRHMRIKQKTATAKLLKQQKQALHSLRNGQVMESERLGFEYAKALQHWVDAYQQELEDRARPKAPPPKPNPFA